MKTNVRGLEIEVSKVRNPQLKRVMQLRRSDFLFYSDRHTDYTAYSDYGNHSDNYMDCDYTVSFDDYGD